MITDHWSKRTIDFLAPHVSSARELVRVATGFFTVEGYDLLRPYLAQGAMHLMVGYDEASRARLRAHLIEQVMLHLRQWDAANRRTAVQNLATRLEAGELRIAEQGYGQSVDARLRRQDHAKVVIVDSACALVGSSNLTVNGLLSNVEGVTCVQDPEQVVFWVESFQRYWSAPDTVDLTQALLDALNAWLTLRLPYDIYLKTVLALAPNEPEEPPRPSYKMPVAYQRVVVERLLRQMKAWGGAMLVASTGLGKTVMATHMARRLRDERHVDNVIVFAPKPVHTDWEQALESAGLYPRFFTRELLDHGGRAGRETRRLEEALARVDDKYLIIVDESQYFRNRLQASSGKPRRSFRRLAKAVDERRPLIVLLTATPLGKDVEDLNNQLLLLPHTAEPDYLDSRGQFVMAGIGDHLVHPTAWKVHDSDTFFDEFINLPVCTVISTSHVARDFAQHSKAGDYIDFGDERRWLPQIEIKKIRVPVPTEVAMSRALAQGVFRHRPIRYRTRDGIRSSTDIIQQQTEIAWTSSPAALREVLQRTMDGDYQVQFHKTPAQRQAALEPILKELARQSHRHDEKFLTLCHYLREFHTQKRKVLVFTERHETALYLEQSLAKELPEVKVGSVIAEGEKGPELKDFEREVLPLLLNFAPVANADKIPPDHTPQRIDVLITTDAYSTGVNLQDASVVISYDLAWTPDVIIQRAGRILRFWNEPRLVHLYVFVGDFQEHPQAREQTHIVEHRLRLLTRRGRQAEKFSAVPVFPEQETIRYASLADLASVTVEDLGLVDAGAIEEFSGVSRFLRHITELNANLAYAATIPDDLSSARTYGGADPLVYVLLRRQDAYHWAVYDVRYDRLETYREDKLLDLLQCSPDTPLAEVDPEKVETLAQRCRALWMEQNRIDRSETVERVCALYLQPAQEQSEIDAVLRNRLGG
jgi:hypothetical protein